MDRRSKLAAPINRSVILLAFSVCAGAAAFGQTAPSPFTTEDHEVRSGEVRLSARLYLPNNQKEFPVIVLVAGSGNESFIGGFYTQAVAGAFASKGIGTLAYDKRGTGKSTGQFTGSDFKILGADAAAVVRSARQLKNVKQVGLWGISQAGWIIPYALGEKPPAEFAILVSPAGVHPHEQMGFFLHNQLKRWGLSAADVAKAETMHEETSLYYAGRLDHDKAQATVSRYKDEPWFKKVVTHPYWDEMTPDGVLLTPPELAEALAKRPQDFEIYRAPSSFEEYEPVYSALTVPTLVIYGSADELVPVNRSRAVMETVLRKSGVAYEIKVFDGASHDIQTPDDRVRQDYLDFMAGWARARFTKSD